MIGVVTKGFGKYYRVHYEDGVLNCVLRGKMRRIKHERDFSDPVAVGDNVDFEINEDGDGVINHVLDRKNVFTRKDKMRPREDILAANIDQVIVIQSFSDPEFNLRFVDRLLVRGEKEGVAVVLCVNKFDLSFEDEIEYIDNYYKGTDLTTVYVSAKDGHNIESLRKLVVGKRSIFSGYSGVGKSSILNTLFPGLDFRTSDVSLLTGKGRHTTTNVELITFEDGTGVIDTPGVREFGLVDIPSKELSTYFHEFHELKRSCKYNSCVHDQEPGCAVKEMVEDGLIDEDRYISYLNILYSIQEYEDNRYKGQ